MALNEMRDSCIVHWHCATQLIIDRSIEQSRFLAIYVFRETIQVCIRIQSALV